MEDLLQGSIAYAEPLQILQHENERYDEIEIESKTGNEHISKEPVREVMQDMDQQVTIVQEENIEEKPSHRPLSFNQLTSRTSKTNSPTNETSEVLEVNYTATNMIESIHEFSGTASLGLVSVEHDYTLAEITLPSENTKTDTEQESKKSEGASMLSWFSTQAAAPPSDTVKSLRTSDDNYFEIASDKRNADFHELFPELDAEEPLIDDYTCAWLKEILIHGRMYISQKSICFYSKIIWTYKIIIPFPDIIAVEKKTVAGFFQNAIEISVLDQKHFFGSFLNRESCYNMITSLIASHPDNTIVLADRSKFSSPTDSAIDKNEPLNLKRRDSNIRSKSLGEVERPRSVSLVETEEDLGLAFLAHPKTVVPEPDRAGSPQLLDRHVILPKKLSVPQKGDPVLNRPLISQKPKSAILHHEASKVVKCQCEPLSIALIDVQFPIPLNQVFEHVFGYESAKNGFSNFFWSESQKHQNIRFTEWVSDAAEIDGDWSNIKSPKTVKTYKQLEAGHVRRLEYIVPLYNPLGPKQTSCIIKQKIKEIGPGYICVLASHETPDVPSGTSFIVHVLICLSEHNNETRMVVTGKIEWIKSSWVKAIEMTVPESLRKYFKELSEELVAYKRPDIKENETPDSPPVETLNLQSQTENGISSHHAIPVNFSVVLLVFFCIQFFSLIYLYQLHNQVEDLKSKIESIQGLGLSESVKYEL